MDCPFCEAHDGCCDCIERVMCKSEADVFGHTYCGWNFDAAAPVFQEPNYFRRRALTKAELEAYIANKTLPVW